MACTFYSCFKKWRRYCLLNCLYCLVISCCPTYTYVSYAFIYHNCLNICKVKVNKSRYINKICYTLYCLLQNLISLLKCIRHSCASVYYLKKFIIRNNYKCIYTLLKSFYTCNRISHSLLVFKSKRLSNNTNSKYSHTLSYLSYNWCCSCSCSAAHTAGNKNHVCTLKCISYILDILLGSLLTYLRLSSCTKSFS